MSQAEFGGRGLMERTMEDYYDILEAERPDDALNGMKAEVAWALGLEECSDEWEELLEV